MAHLYFLHNRLQAAPAGTPIDADQPVVEVLNSLEIGDEVTTIGGIVGRVVAIKEDTFVLETGSDRTKIRFRRAAIQSIEKLNMEGAQTSSK